MHDNVTDQNLNSFTIKLRDILIQPARDNGASAVIYTYTFGGPRTVKTTTYL